jgi:hypothetical protein
MRLTFKCSPKTMNLRDLNNIKFTLSLLSADGDTLHVRQDNVTFAPGHGSVERQCPR